MIVEPTGVYPVVVFDAVDSWHSLLPLASPHLDVRGLNRLKPVLDGVCKCVVLERDYIDKDYRDTFSNFHSKRFSTPVSRCLRLHFFDDPISEEQIVASPSTAASHYLGYSVIRPTKPNCVGRTMLSHRLRTDKTAHLSYCTEGVSLLGSRIEVQGFPFISQDADATVCAESALWMLLRYYSTKYPWYSEILPFQITSLAAHHAVGKRVYPSAGLFSWQLAEALRLQRFSPVIYSRAQYADFDHLLYTYIESGLPLLITVPSHVVVGYGHRSDYKKERPPGQEFVYTSHFNEAYIVNDDNCFPYQTLGSNGAKGPTDSKYNWGAVEEFIVPLPERVFLPAEQVRIAAEIILKHKTVGIAARSPILAGKELVYRLFLTSSKSFKRSLRSRGMGDPAVEQIYRRLPMPHFIWVCEIAEYADYANDRKILGEILWDATRNAHEPDGWIALHYPEELLVDVGAAFNRRQELQTLPLAGKISYSLFVSNLHSL